MSFRKRFLLWLVSVLMAGCTGALVRSTLKSSAAQGPTAIVAIVDGNTISDGEAEKVYNASLGRPVGDLILCKLICDAFNRTGQKAQSKDIVYPPYLRTRDDYAAFGLPLYSAQYLRRLILLPWPTARLRKAHALFADELAQYDVSFMEILHPEDLPALMEDLGRDEDFATIVARYANDELGNKHEYRRWYSSTELEECFGREASNTLMRLKPGSSSKPVREGSKIYLFNLNKVRKSFKDLQPALEQRAVEAGKTAFLYNLLSPAKVTVTGALNSDPESIDYRL